MNKKDLKRKLREKEAFEKKQEENRKIKFVKGITAGGPVPNISFIADSTRSKHIVILITDPIYCAAIYIYTKKLTALNEMIAAFSHCIKRENK